MKMACTKELNKYYMSNNIRWHWWNEMELYVTCKISREVAFGCESC